MMNVRNSVSIGAGAAAVALVGTVALGSLALPTGLVVAMLVIAAFGSVAFSAQVRRFESGRRAVYQPVYVRSCTVHRRVSSLDD